MLVARASVLGFLNEGVLLRLEDHRVVLDQAFVTFEAHCEVVLFCQFFILGLDMFALELSNMVVELGGGKGASATPALHFGGRINHLLARLEKLELSS